MNSRWAIVLLMTAATTAVVLISLPTAVREPPGPVWDLAESSDLIVLADVEKVSGAAEVASAGRARMPSGTDLVAHLKVRETWKGRRQVTVDVAFNDFARWPAPPEYVAGEKVVAFLRRGGREWTTVGMSAGAIHKRDDDLRALREQVREAVAHQRKDLSPDQQRLEEIATRFMERAPTDESLAEILRILADYQSADVDRAAIGAFESALDRPSPPPWTRDAMLLILARLGDPAPEARLAGLSRISTRNDVLRARAIWRAARKELGEAAEPLAGHGPDPGTAPLAQ